MTAATDFPTPAAPQPLAGRVIVITGASSGIGEAAAKQLAAQGATLCLVARRADELAVVVEAIRAAGGRAEAFPADLTSPPAVTALVAALSAAHPAIDVLINNAGRSIRRPILEALDRAHDYERTMAINYLAPVRLTLGLLPALLAAKGQVVNVSSVAALLSTPRFSAYLASKSALDAFSRSLRIELGGQGLSVTGVHFPLVKTAMTAPTAVYRHIKQMDVTDAAGWLVRAVRERPARLAPWPALAMYVATAAAPGPALALLEGFYRRRAGRLMKKLAAEGAAASPPPPPAVPPEPAV